MRGIALWLCTVCASLAGCVTDRDWHPPATVAPESLSAQNTLASVTVQEQSWPVDAWWKAFGDPQLDKLMDEALAGAPTLTIAEARLHAAQAGFVIVSVSRVTAPSRASMRPSIVAPVVTVMSVSAMTEPRNVDPVPRVAELPTCQ